MNAAGKNAFWNAAAGMYDLAQAGTRLNSGFVRLNFNRYGDPLQIMLQSPISDPQSRELSTPNHRIKDIRESHRNLAGSELLQQKTWRAAEPGRIPGNRTAML